MNFLCRDHGYQLPNPTASAQSSLCPSPNLILFMEAHLDSTVTTLKFELFPDRSLTLLPYHNVKNSPEVFAALRSGKLPGTGFLNPAYV